MASSCTMCAAIAPRQCPKHRPIVSGGTDSLDSLVQAASVPNLASLFRTAKARGVLTAGPEYGGPTK